MNLRQKIARLAQVKPQLRSYLLPLLKTAHSEADIVRVLVTFYKDNLLDVKRLYTEVFSVEVLAEMLETERQTLQALLKKLTRSGIQGKFQLPVVQEFIVSLVQFLTLLNRNVVASKKPALVRGDYPELDESLPLEPYEFR